MAVQTISNVQPFLLIRFCEATQGSDTSEVELQLMFSKTADVSLSYRPSWVVPKVFSGSGVNTKMKSIGEWSRSGEARSASFSGDVSEYDSPVCDSVKRIECGRYSHGCWACDTPWHLQTHTHTRTSKPVHANNDLMRYQDEDEDYLAIPVEELASR